MSDSDPIDDGVAAAMTTAAAVSRVAEVLLRQAQDEKLRRAREDQATAHDAALQLAARAEVAEAFYRQASDSEWLRGADVAEIRAAVEGAYTWAEVDPDRFRSAADDLGAQLQALYAVDVREAYVEHRNAAAVADLAAAGVAEAREREKDADRSARSADMAAAYDSAPARSQRERALVAAGADHDFTTARVVSDKLNAHDPRDAARAGHPKLSKAPGRRGGARHDQQRGR